MSKIIPVLFFFTCLGFQSCAQTGGKEKSLKLKTIYQAAKAEIEQTLNTFGLKANVKSVQQHVYTLPPDSLVDLSAYKVCDLSQDRYHHTLADAGMNQDCKLTFNASGKLLYREAYGERFSSDAMETDTLYYNANGDLVKRKNRLVGKDFEFIHEDGFEYNQQGHLVAQVTDGQTIAEYTYDEVNNKVQVTGQDASV